MSAQPHISLFCIALFATLLCAAAANDIRSYRISNSLSLAIMILYLPFVLASGGGVDFWGGLTVGGLVLVVGFVLFSLGFMGGGDTKLLAVTAMWAGPAHIFDFLIVTGLVGGVMGLLMLSRIRFGCAMFFERIGFARLSMVCLGTVLPYGIAIAAGGLVVAGHLAFGPVQ